MVRYENYPKEEMKEQMDALRNQLEQLKREFEEQAQKRRDRAAELKNRRAQAVLDDMRAAGHIYICAHAHDMTMT